MADGLAGDDQFTFSNAIAVEVDITGGTGNDTIVGPAGDATWEIDGITAFSAVENLIGSNAADVFHVATGGSLSGTLDGGLDNADAPADDSLDFSALAAPVTVDLSLASGASSATGIHAFATIDAITGSASTADVLSGPGAAGDAVSWDVTGLDAGTVEGTQFAGFENLRGRGATSDAFSFEAGGSLTGTVDGGVGVGSADAFRVASGAQWVAFQPTAADRSGTVTIAGKAVRYVSMDSSNPVTGDGANRTITGSACDRRHRRVLTAPRQQHRRAGRGANALPDPPCGRCFHADAATCGGTAR